MQFNLPTWLTLLRIILIPVMVAVFYLPWHLAHVACGAIFAVAGLTDWLDGYLARKMSQTTLFGAFLDPVADKLMVSIALVLIVQADPNPWVAIASAVIIGREITIASLREWMAEIGQRSKVDVSWIGKWKTTAQMVAIVTLLLGMDVWTETLKNLGQVLLLLSAVLTLWSMFNYLQAALPELTKHDQGV